MTKEQTHTVILLKYKDEKYIDVATRNGNNAACLCVCGYRLPLIFGGNTPNKPTVCGGCKRKFKALHQIDPPKVPYEVIEIPSCEITDITEEQEQIPISLKYKSKDEQVIGVAIKTGNNAAWMCVCGYQLPLIWSRFFAEQNSQEFVICKKCGRKYKGEGSPDTILEIEK